MNGNPAPDRLRRRSLVVAAFLAAAVLVLPAAACTGGGSPAGSGGRPSAGRASTSPSAVAYSACMRSHGVPNWPDPSIDSQGRPVFAISISKLGFNPYSSRIWAQGNQCSHLMQEVTGAPFQVSP
jgi:hypothetical protein